MNVLVVGSRNHGPKNDPAVIAKRLQADGIAAELLYWEDVTFAVATGRVQVLRNGLDIFEQAIDLVIAVGWYKSGKDALYRDVAYAFSLVATVQGVRLWNSEMGMQRSTSKLSCMVQLALHGLRVPASTFSLGDVAHIQRAHLPFIAKGVAASRGASNYLVTTEEQRRDVVARMQSSRFLVQPFMPNDHDLRVICFGGKPQLILRRSRQKDAKTHLNNTSQGGEYEWLDLGSVSSTLLTKCEEICNIMKREMAGIDFIPDADSPYGYSCLEVNAVPQLTSGADIERKMAALSNSVLKESK